MPFAGAELGVGAGHNLKYEYPQLMELAVALALRTQGILSRHISSGCWRKVAPSSVPITGEHGLSANPESARRDIF